MKKILVNKLTGAMALIPSNSELGVQGRKLLDSEDTATVDLADDLLEAFKAGHCEYKYGKIALTPEKLWIENQSEGVEDVSN